MLYRLINNNYRYNELRIIYIFGSSIKCPPLLISLSKGYYSCFVTQALPPLNGVQRHIGHVIRDSSTVSLIRQWRQTCLHRSTAVTSRFLIMESTHITISIQLETIINICIRLVLLYKV